MAAQGDDMVDDASKAYPRIISMVALQGITIPLALLALILTTTLLALTWRSHHRIYPSTLLTLLASLLAIPYTISTLIDDTIQHAMQSHSLGLTTSRPSLARIETAFKTEVACTVLFWLIIYASKSAVLAVYWRMLGTARGRMARNVWFGLASVTALFFGIIFMSVFWVCGSPVRVGDFAACQSMDKAAATRLLVTWCVLNLGDFVLILLFPLTLLPSFSLSHPIKLTTPQTLLLPSTLLLSAFFLSLDILRTYWNLSLPLSSFTNLIFLWRCLEPLVATTLAALVGLVDWCRVQDAAADGVSENDDRSWIKLGDVGRKGEEEDG